MPQVIKFNKNTNIVEQLLQKSIFFHNFAKQILFIYIRKEYAE